MTNHARKFIAKEEEFKGSFSRKVLESLWWAWSEKRGRLLSICYLGLVGRATLLSTSLVIGYWADSLCTGALCKTLPAGLSSYTNIDFLKLLIFLILFGVIHSILFFVTVARTGTRVAERYLNETMLRVSRAPMEFFDKNPVGRIFTRFSSDYQYLTMASGPHFSQFIAIVLDLSIMTVLISITNFLFLPLLLLTMGVNFLIYRWNHPVIREKRRQAASQRGPSIAHFSATVQGFLAIRIFGREKIFSRAFDKLLNRYYRERVSGDFAFHFFGFQLSSTTAILVVVCGLFGIYLISVGQASIGEVGIIVTFVTMASGIIQRLFQLVASMEQGMAGAERLNQYLRMNIEPYSCLPVIARFPTDHAKELGAEQQCENGSGRLEAIGLTLSYGPELPNILTDVNFTIEPGQSVGLIGRTGSGKSSLFQSLFSLYPLKSGKILVDGRELKSSNSQVEQSMSLKQWRRQFAYVSQDPAVFKGTLRQNLVLARNFSDDELVKVIGEVGLGNWFRTLPNGLDSEITEGGANLSAGQRQLLSTARCLLKDAPIVLMDEATSAIDPASEEAFLRAADKHLSSKSRLIIAHRLTTVEACDRIIWLHDGKIRAEGDPISILADYKKFETSE